MIDNIYKGQVVEPQSLNVVELKFKCSYVKKVVGPYNFSLCLKKHLKTLMFGESLFENRCMRKFLKSILKLHECSLILYWLKVCIERII